MTSPGPDSSVAGPRAVPEVLAERPSVAPAVTAPPLAAQLTDVWRSYPLHRSRDTLVALHGVSLDVPAGQRLALLGPNGSGKSTLLRILATLDRPDARAGTAVSLLGAPLRGSVARNIRARLGVVFQAAGLDELLTVRENLAAQASLYGLRGPAAAERIGWATQRLGLTDRLHDRVGTLSGGLARRVDLARALLHDPDLLLLDEPTTGLDPRAREDFLGTVESVAAEPRAPGRPPMTIIMSTHLMEEAQRAQRVVLLHRGRIVADEAPDALRHRVGGVIIRCQAAGDMAALAQEILAGAGMGTSAAANAGGAVIVGRVPEGRTGMEQALVGLVRAGVPFEVGPPTLGDVFLSMTGEDLDMTDPAAAGAHGVPRHRARRKRR